MSKTFCALPWVNISADPDGSVKPCCISTDYIKRSDGTKFNLGIDPISDIINSEDFVCIRNKMLDGQPISGCSQCYVQEASGGKSQRMLHNSQWKTSPKIKQGSVIEPTVEYFDLRFGNMCNLSCRSCFPGYSSQMAKDVNDNQKLQKFHPILSENLNHWYTTEMYENNIRGQYDNIKQLYITGGEPTIIKQNYVLLESLVNEGKNTDITLLINTNMTNLQGRWLELLKEFKSVILFASIDGIGKVQEYIRYPSNWKQIDDNFTTLVELNLANVQIRPTPVIQATNLGNIVELFEYFEQFNRLAKKTVVDMMPIILENPSYLNLVHLPLDYKKSCMNKIQTWINQSCRYQSSVFYTRMRSLVAKCHQEPVDDERRRFFEYNAILDEHRSESLASVNNELWELR